MKKFESEMDKLESHYNTMFKVAFAFIAFVFCAVLCGWALIGYVAVTKGPETVHRIERIGDAYADKLEQENKSNKKPE